MLYAELLRLLVGSPLVLVGMIVGTAMILRGCATVYVSTSIRVVEYTDLESGQAWIAPHRSAEEGLSRIWLSHSQIHI